MAVLTPVDESHARALMTAFGLGTFARIEGIAAGSVNSNFALHARDGRRFFLRLYEEQDLAGAIRETEMLGRLARSGVPTPAPVAKTDGGFVVVVQGKPAAVFPWRQGRMRCQASGSSQDAARVGEALARVHVAGRAEIAEAGRFRLEHLLRRLDDVERSGHVEFAPFAPRLRRWLTRIDSARNPSLPRGLMHGDLFRDNVLWDEEGKLSALLDFESACEGTYVYDLMVTVLSWCYGDDFDPALATAIREGYESVRPLEEAEKEALCTEGSFAALRFTVTRITDYAMRVTDGPRVVKDWRRFLKRFNKLEELGSAGVRELLGLS